MHYRSRMKINRNRNINHLNHLSSSNNVRTWNSSPPHWMRKASKQCNGKRNSTNRSANQILQGEGLQDRRGDSRETRARWEGRPHKGGTGGPVRGKNIMSSKTSTGQGGIVVQVRGKNIMSSKTKEGSRLLIRNSLSRNYNPSRNSRSHSRPHCNKIINGHELNRLINSMLNTKYYFNFF